MAGLPQQLRGHRLHPCVLHRENTGKSHICKRVALTSAPPGARLCLWGEMTDSFKRHGVFREVWAQRRLPAQVEDAFCTGVHELLGRWCRDDLHCSCRDKKCGNRKCQRQQIEGDREKGLLFSCTSFMKGFLPPWDAGLARACKEFMKCQKRNAISDMFLSKGLRLS